MNYRKNMASKNSVREYDSHAYYHIYNRGVEKRSIFKDDEDYTVFLAMLARYLDNEPHKDKSGRLYRKYDSIELLTYCLMPNHFHLFIYQAEETKAFTDLLRSVSTAYTIYFNRKYQRVGHLFQDRFKASRISDDSYFQHISRYIHLNPSEPETYRWSSLPYYLGQGAIDWLKPERVLMSFNDSDDYLNFLRDHQDYKSTLDNFQEELADN